MGLMIEMEDWGLHILINELRTRSLLYFLRIHPLWSEILLFFHA